MIDSVTHIHTKYSYDSLIDPRALVERLVEQGIGLALVVDHDSFRGSIEARECASKSNAGVAIPVAAEVLTELGDVIIIVNGPPVPSISELKDWQSLRRFACASKGLIWLPHPFRSHKNIEELATSADVIEMFNSRCTRSENDRAQKLCASLQKPYGYGSDAHLGSECLLNVVKYRAAGSLVEILSNSPECRKVSYTTARAVARSQVIKAVKQRRPRLMARSVCGWLKHTCVNALCCRDEYSVAGTGLGVASYSRKSNADEKDNPAFLTDPWLNSAEDDLADRGWRDGHDDEGGSR